MISCKKCHTSFSPSNKYYSLFVCASCGELNSGSLPISHSPGTKQKLMVPGPFKMNGFYFIRGERYKITGCIQMITDSGVVLLWNLDRAQVKFEFIIQLNDSLQIVTSDPVKMETVKNIKIGTEYSSPFDKGVKKFRINFMDKVKEVFLIGELNCQDLNFENSIIMNSFKRETNESLFFIVNNEEKLVYKSFYLPQSKF